LSELRTFATDLTRLSKLLTKMESQENAQFESDQVVTVFMIHFSSVFARNMVEILIRLSLAVEPHISFWEQQCRLNNARNRSRWLNHLKLYSPLSISVQKARIFRKLSSDLHAQMGRMQCWFWEMVALKEAHGGDHDQRYRQSMDRVTLFIAEMQRQYKAAEHDEHSEEKGGGNVMDAMMEVICCADSWTIKVQKEMDRLGRPSYLQQHFKTLSFYSLSLAMWGSLLYLKWGTVRWLAHSLGTIGSNFVAEHLYLPLRGIVEDVLYLDAQQKEENELSYELERATLSKMITSFERKHLGVAPSADSGRADMTLIMAQYEKDIENPIVSATKGSLLTNVFVQIQKMKVELSKLMIDVDAIIDSNRLNMEVMATIPFVGTLYLLHQVYSNRSGSKKLQKESQRELRFLFRSIFSILIKFDEYGPSTSDREQYLENEEQGLVLLLIYKCFLWQQQQPQSRMAKEDRIWFLYDLNHFISKRFGSNQGMALLQRMETYYLRC